MHRTTKMNTKTMRLPPRRVATATTSSLNNKRKERDGSDPLKPHPPHPPPKLSKPNPDRLGSDSDSKPLDRTPSNQLLAGYLAHEFLTKGTLFGQPFDPARSEAVAAGAQPKKPRPSQKTEAEPTQENHQRYVDVSRLLKADGAHLPGIVNPTQLARFLQM